MQVGLAQDAVTQGTTALVEAKTIKKRTNKLMLLALLCIIVIAVIIAVVIVLAIHPWSG